MELRQYLKILVGRWWIILPSIFIGLTGALMFSYSRTPIYESSTSYVGIISESLTANNEQALMGLDLTGRQRTYATYCLFFLSPSVRDQALQMLGVDPAAEFLAKYKFACANPPESNVMLVTIQGTSPTFANNLNEALGLAATARINALYPLSPIHQLDPATVDTKPISPKYPQMAVFGGIFGLILGVTSAILIEYLRRPADIVAQASIRNPIYGVYNEQYFQTRFQAELQRAGTYNRPISMAFLRLQPNEDWGLIPEQAQQLLIRSIALQLDDQVSAKGHIVSYLKPLLFGVLLIEASAKEAERQVEALQTFIRSYPAQTEDGFQMAFASKAGVVVSSGNLMDYPKLMEAATEALKNAEADPKRSFVTVHAAPRPFLTMEEMDMLGMDETPQFDEATAPAEAKINGGRLPKVTRPRIEPELAEIRAPDTTSKRGSLLARVTEELTGEEPK